MQLFAFGINHQTAPLALREQVVFHAENLVQALRDLVDRNPVKEAAIISTCNRTEVYCDTTEPRQALHWLAEYHQLKDAAPRAVRLSIAARTRGQARVSRRQRA